MRVAVQEGETTNRKLTAEEEGTVKKIVGEAMKPSVTVTHIRGDRTIHLTKREIEVLSLIIDGKSSKEVAEGLFISKRTVDFHLANIYEKLQVSNRVQAFRRATSLGLIPFELTGVREN